MIDKKFSYKVKGEEVSLNVDTDHIAIKFNEPFPKSSRSKFVANSDHLGEFSNRLEIPGEKYTIYKLAEVQKERPKRYNNAMTSLTEANEITNAVPVFISGNKKVVATDKIIVGFEKGSKVADAVIEKYKCQKIENSYDSYLLKIPENKDLFKLLGEIEKEKGVKYVEPNFITIGSNSTRIIGSEISKAGPNIDDKKDLSEMQYALKITQADKSWELQKGSKNIKIAILDEGIDSNHPDLNGVIEKSFDALDDDGFQEPNEWDGHGTACCGLAAAKHKSFGVKGLSAGCSVYAVRIAQSLKPGGNWSTDNFTIKKAIDWSWENGADIISNSWGGGAPSNDIIDAFERARTNGRNKKGCVIIIAAGNEDSNVTFPGNLMEVLTVSASNEYDEPKTKTSKDGEYWWGSCFGPEVDVAAPGVHNLTTDITGRGGYNKESNYTDFNGTSSATPIVAGIAGLILSANPNLIESQVRLTIKETADKVGNVSYYNGHNDRMGFGRVNALNAINTVLSRIKKTTSSKK
jgi:thermitase